MKIRFITLSCIVSLIPLYYVYAQVVDQEAVPQLIEEVEKALNNPSDLPHDPESGMDDQEGPSAQELSSALETGEGAQEVPSDQEAPVTTLPQDNSNAWPKEPSKTPETPVDLKELDQKVHEELGIKNEDIPNKEPAALPAGPQPVVPQEPQPEGGNGKNLRYTFASFSILNKTTGHRKIIKVKVGDVYTFERIDIKLHSCQARSAEYEPEEGAALEIFMTDRSKDSKRIFSGWILKSRPSLSALSHPIYDVWLQQCLM
jgi:hypothetical protein